MGRQAIAFRIIEAHPQGDALPPSMLLPCELDTVPPVPFHLRMRGRGLDDPNAGHSPKWLIVDRADVPAFVAQVARAFEVAVPEVGSRGARIEWTTTLLESFSGRDAEGEPRYEDVLDWRADKWNLDDSDVELYCDYNLVERRGEFSPGDAPDAIVAALARATQRPT